MPNPSEPVNADQELREQPARDYCLRLAEQIKAFPPRPRRHQADKDRPETEEQRQQRLEHQAAFAAERKNGLLDSWRQVFHPKAAPDIESSSPELLRDILLAEPRVQARLASIVEYPPSKWLLEQELAARGDWPASDEVKAVLTREEKWIPSDGVPDVYDVAALCQLKGLCFSGGGIRSATFNLGVLQGIAALKKLSSFDYLSTVSGGGYIHQFLASWISCEDVNRVQHQLQPLPGPPSQRTFWPEPLRWLRRYSNYLTPQKGLFTADTWVAFAIWLRNTFLNQIVLISTILLILLLPHFYLSSRGQFAHFLLAHGGVTAAIILAGFLFASGIIFFTQMTTPPTDHCHPAEESGFGQTGVLSLVFAPILIAVLAFCPYLYRSSFWSGIRLPEQAPKSATELKHWSAVHHVIDTVAWPESTGIVPVSTRVYISHLHRLVPAPEAKPSTDPKKPDIPLPGEAGGLDNLRAWQSAYAFSWWKPFDHHFDDDTSTSLVFTTMLFGIALLVASAARAIPVGWKRLIVLLGMAGAVGCGYVLINLSRLAIFGVSFFLPLDHVTRAAIPLLPWLGLTVVFVSIEIAGGLVGNLVDESVREWFARLRAWSFLFGIVWFALTASSLLGPGLVVWLFHVVHVGKPLWIGWIGTTLASVLAGKSSFVSGGGKDQDSKAGKLLNLLVLIGPPVFILGLVLSLAYVIEKALLTIESQIGNQVLPHSDFLCLLALLAATAILFGWRIDINEFSLHAFYRDRLARCYAGATNPDRRANRFTGFAASDKRLRLVDLLPTRFGNRSSEALWARCCDADCPSNTTAQTPTYKGPFPIFCTTINLTFGQDLAYQERKGGAFAFTPLYCGYDVGWTETDSDRVQFNGFTPTRNFAYDDGGPHMATAVATSGAAMSPNMGYHSSPTMSFLLTIFNVRLGLWIRNPRHKRFRLRSRGNASSPWFGLFYLFAELFGMVNDEAAFVYLTDGGHFENMGLYELVRRHCSTIVLCDAEQDGDLAFGGIGMAIRKCRIDFGAEIDLDISQLELKGTPPASPVHCIEGTVRYPNGVVGSILYIKSSFTNNLPADLINYHKEHPAFPNDSTLNQWFTESQFESYRRLGHHSVTTGEAVNWINGSL